MQLLFTSIAVSFSVLSLALIGLYLLNKSVDESDIKRGK
jgi:multisubunit Na+/H+ antiporter MnhC subunit